MLIKNSGFFFLSLINTAVITVYPQKFFEHAPNETRSIWLSATLLLGAIFSIIGVRGAEWSGLRRRPLFYGNVFSTILCLMILAGGGGYIVSSWAFVINQCLICFGVNLLGQELDVRSVMIAGHVGRNRNDLIITGYRFFGMLMAPLVFSFVSPGTLGAQLILGVGSALVFVSTWLLCQPRTEEGASRDATLAVQSASAREPLGERVLDAFSLSVYSCYCLLAASAAYLLHDLHGLSDSSTRALRLISIVYATALIGTVVVTLAKKKANLGWLLVAPVALLGVGYFVRLEPGAIWLYEILGSASLGLGFALFLIAYRDRLSFRALQEKNPGLIARYNSTSRISTLLGAFLMFTIAALNSVTHQGFSWLTAVFLSAFSSVLFATALWLIWKLGTMGSRSSIQNPAQTIPIGSGPPQG